MRLTRVMGGNRWWAWAPEHPRANNRGYVLEHILIAERALGRPLPNDSVVHHVDENSLNNRNDNLVICPNSGYHNFLHTRMRALEACGNVDWRPCVFCKQYDDLMNLTIRPAVGNRFQYHHDACNAAYSRRYRAGAHP